jgi:hypothetical protein
MMSTMAQWIFLYLMPHTGFNEPIEHGRLAIVPPSDPRLQALASSSPAVRQLTSRFTDSFGHAVEPSALLKRADAPASLDFEAVVAFRNVVAISSMTDAWTMHFSGGTAQYPLWADYFDFYPLTATLDGHLFGQTVASAIVTWADNFVGQKAPHLQPTSYMSFGLDRPVLESCLAEWEQRFLRGRKTWRTRVLFRSLEIACQASRVPAIGTQRPTIHDMGVGIALWVSALEILSHPRTQWATLQTVLNLLDRAWWLDPRLGARRYRHRQGKNKTVSVNLAAKLYCELYRARNDFLHGNPVTHHRLFPSKRAGGPMLLHCGPLIYRAALLAFLGYSRPQSKDLTSGKALAEWMKANQLQRNFEKAFLFCSPSRYRR